jgi:hypothetical protein
MSNTPVTGENKINTNTPPTKFPVVTVNILPGQASPAQKLASARFWQKLIAGTKIEAAK